MFNRNNELKAKKTELALLNKEIEIAQKQHDVLLTNIRRLEAIYKDMETGKVKHPVIVEAVVNDIDDV